MYALRSSLLAPLLWILIHCLFPSCVDRAGAEQIDEPGGGEGQGDLAPSALQILRLPVPSWVRGFPDDFRTAEPTDEERRALGGVWYLLTEIQHDVESEALFHHGVRRFLTPEGIGGAGTITFGIDPSYQKLVFHSLRIHRDGRVIDRLPQQTFESVRTEAERERQIYSGEVDAIALVEGIEVGDLLEYSASVVGRNPVFEGGFAGTYRTNWSVPVRQARVRLRVPLDAPREYATAAVHGEFPIVRTVRDDHVEFLWEARDVSAVEAEDYAPEWLGPFGWIEASDFGSWRNVADWAVRQYPIAAQLPPSMEGEMEALRALADDEDRVVAALRYAQDNVRYVGMFDGVHSHRPHSLETIVRRGFGDCKDKSLLLCAMLRAVGVDAVPALVHTEYRHKISEWLPSPYSFDHIITCARIGDRQYWIDPTQSSQRGPLHTVFLPDYRKALLVESGVDGLTDIPRQGHEHARAELFEEFRFEDYGGEATLRVISSYYGAEADRVRSAFAVNSHDDIQKGYLDFYARSYPVIEAEAPIELEEDPEQNRVVVRESYRVSGFWDEREGEDPDARFANFYLMSAYDELIAPDSRARTLPFRVEHPVDLRQELSIHFPDDLELPCDSFTITHPVFEYEYRETSSGDLFTATAHYQSLRDHVLPEEIEQFRKDVNAAEDKTSFWISIPRQFADGTEVSEPFDIADLLPDRRTRITVFTLIGGALLLGVGLGVYFIVLGFRVGKKTG